MCKLEPKMIRPTCFVLFLLIWPVHAAPSRSSQNITVTALALRVPRQAASSSSTVDMMDFDIGTPWEESLMSSPMVVALLGQLMVISSKIDFPVVENAPKDGFKYMRHPESFRASVVQVSNDGWFAFVDAHSNMAEIQSYMQQIPAEVQTIVKLLTSGSPRLIYTLLPIYLNRIQFSGETCVQLSADAEWKFADLIMLVGDLLRFNETGFNEISDKETLDLLRQGIELLARIRQEWRKSIEFFTLLSLRTENALKNILGPFLEMTRQGEQVIGELTPEERRFYLEQLMVEGDEINRVSYFLYSVSSTYYDVSSRFLLPRMADLTRMLATDSEAERTRLLAQLLSEAEQAEDAIKQLAQDRRQQFTRVLQARKEELQSIVDRFGPTSKIESKAIRGPYAY